MFNRKKCRDCAPRDLVIRIREQKDRAEDVAVALENKIARLQDENKVLKSNNEALEQESRYLREHLQAAEGEAETAKKVINDIRWRVFTLLRSADQDAELFGLPRYTVADPEPGVMPDVGSFGELRRKYHLDEMVDKAAKYVEEHYKPEEMK